MQDADQAVAGLAPRRVVADFAVAQLVVVGPGWSRPRLGLHPRYPRPWPLRGHRRWGASIHQRVQPLQPAVAQRHLEAEVANCVGGVLSPLLANIALHGLDEHVHGPWRPGGIMSTPRRRARRRAKNLPNWRIVRYADDFVILVHGDRSDVETAHEALATVLAPLGLRLSAAKTRVLHMSEGFDFLGFRIQWKRKRGTTKWYVYTFIADRPVRSLKAKIRALTDRLSQQPPRVVLIKLNQIMRGWANYFRHAVCKHTMNSLERFAWSRVIRWWMKRHRWNWTDVRRRLTGPSGRWRRPSADGIELFNIASVPITRYRYRGAKIPNPWMQPHPA